MLVSKLQKEYEALEACFEQIRHLYNETKCENERLQSYTQLLQSVLDHYNINYPSIQLEEDIDF